MTDFVTPTPTGHPRAPGNVPTEKAAKAKIPSWLVRTTLGLIAAVVLVIGYLLASVTVPLMWATAIRDQIGGQLGNSIPLGMFYGFTFTFIPVVVAWQAHYRRLNKWLRIAFLGLGLLLTTPNLLTLGVLYGTTGTAADARAIWANSANWFGTWSQLFMVLGVVAGVGLVTLVRLWMRRGRQLRALKAAQKVVHQHDLAQARTAKNNAKAAEKQLRGQGRNAVKGTPPEPPEV